MKLISVCIAILLFSNVAFAQYELALDVQHVDQEAGVSFSYPETFGSEYIRPEVNLWPPDISLRESPSYCGTDFSQTSEDWELDADLEVRDIDSIPYCVRTYDDDVGSPHVDYSYVFDRDGMKIRLAFALNLAECDLISDLVVQNACKEVQASFNLDDLVHRIASTIQFYDGS